MQGSFRAAAVALVLLGAAGASRAAELPPEREAERATVQTAVALARLAEETKDGDAMLVAARLLAKTGPVAMGPAKGGERPAMFDVKKMAARAKELGADPAKADSLRVQPLSGKPGANKPGFWQDDYCPAGYNCTQTWIY